MLKCFKIMTVAVLMAVAGTASAQTMKYPCDRQWYVGVHGGSGMAFGDDDYNVFKEFKEASGYNVSVNAGYNHNRWIGARVQANWMRMHSRINTEAYEEYYLHNHPECVPNKGFYGYNVAQISAEVVCNLTNSMFPNRRNNAYNWVVFAGPGATLTMNYDKIVERWREDKMYYVESNNHLLWNANIGSNMEYRINRSLGINAEIMCSFTGDKLDGIKYEEFYDAIITYSLGLTYYF